MYENEFYHHGIKGQKWGVRRYYNPDGSLTKAGLKRQNRLTQFSGKYSAQDDFTLKKGTKFQRVGSKYEKDDNRRTYVSFEQNDNARYIKYAESLNASHKIDLNSKSDIKVAKGKSIADTFVELMGEKSISEMAAYTKVYDKNGKETANSKKTGKELLKIYKNASKNQESFDKAYATFTRDIMADSNLSSAFYKKLQDKGYNAMYDVNDRDAASNPLIIFNRQKSLQTKRISEIKYQDVDRAIEYLENKGIS